MKARMSMDPGLMSLLGKKLYSKHPLPILVRELLQNSRDAIIRKGISYPQIMITVDVQADNHILVSCTDNGIGMSEQELLDNFLCLGRSNKTGDSSSVGRFGIAKAALMRNPVWSVHTLDNYIDNRFFEQEEEWDIFKTEMLEGTTITATITEPLGWRVLDETKEMVYASDVDIVFSIYKDGVQLVDDPHAGFVHEKILLKSFSEWDLWGFEGVENGGIFSEQRNYFRLNGLLQYATWGSSSRKTNLIVELHPTASPASDSYPLSMSRESISNESIFREVAEQIAKHDDNPLTSKKMIVEVNEKPSDVLRNGNLLRGKRNQPEYIKIAPGYSYIGQEILDAAYAGDAIIGNSDNISEYAPAIPDRPMPEAMLLRYYDNTIRNIYHDSKILAVWRKLLMTIADYNDTFGIGLVGKQDVSASRAYLDGKWYYLLNPAVMDRITNVTARVWMLYDMAVHEVCHYTEESHNELFTTKMHELKLATIMEIEDMIPALKRIIK